MINVKKNYYDQNKQVKYSMSPNKLLSIGVIKEKLNTLEQKEIIEDSLSLQSSLLKMKKEDPEKFAIVEYQLPLRKKILIDRLSSSELNSLNMKLSKTWDRVLTSKEKDLKPFWTKESKEISNKLWLPTEIDCVDSVLNSSKESFPNTLMGKSWFSIKKKHPLTKNSLMTSFQSSLFSHPECMDVEAVKLKKKLKKKKKKKVNEKKYKTIKFRLFPTKEEEKRLQLQFQQFRWYYNSAVNIVYNHYGYDNILKKDDYSNYTIRDLLRQYDYVETQYNNLTFSEYVFDENRNEIFVPHWWAKESVHCRIPRGASDKFTSSLNSAITNFKEKNINKFIMKYRTKKNPTDYIYYEDKRYPSYINKIKGQYWYTSNKNRKIKMQWTNFKAEKSINIIYEKETQKYFLHVSVDEDWFPVNDRRNDNQVKYEVKQEKRLISLDPGVRKFLVGYDPRGETIFIGEKANNEIHNLFNLIDKSTDIKEKYFLWKKVKNMISEMHWKTISFLIENYDTIILPEFRVSEMVKSKKISRKTKRMMLMFSFYSFKAKLKWKCNMHEKKLIIVDESYTSCTCTNCGTINETKGKENLKCVSCGMKSDRDVSGARNIMIKNVVLS